MSAALQPTTIFIGNARPMVLFDTVRRYLSIRGIKLPWFKIYRCDDKIINRAREEGMEPGKLAEKYIEEYFKDAHSLNVRCGCPAKSY